MVPHLNPASAPHSLDSLRSHPHKPLRVHMNGVLAGVERHTDSPIARVAALFHDLGKLNPNFQTKLSGTKPPGYDHHSYLSALAFLNYVVRNPNLASLGLKREEMWAVLALIAHHHGSLPHLRAILNADESERLFNFMATQPDVAASPFLEQWLGHQTFEMGEADARKNWDFQNGVAGKVLEKIERPLDFWLRTQFSFASLIESDKRDAGDNKRFRRDEQLAWAQENFSPALLQVLEEHKTGEQARKPINQVRTTIREEAVASLRDKLPGGERVFTLTAPTGAGKTFILLALAEEIRRARPNLSVLYALPFLSITEQVEGVCRGVWSENPEFVTRLDSRAQNPALDDLLAQIETDPAASERLAQEHFSGQTFDGAFTITTFVQLFETMLSNRNATLLKLPNFRRTIFLLDEVQALPPRLYIFFAAYLREWCKYFDCFAILSTATMPHLAMVSQPGTPANQQPQRLFPDYIKEPTELLNFQAHFQQDVFDRYRIEPRGEWSAAQLADAVEAEEGSTLVILNTIADTRALYEELTKNRDMSGAQVILLNTHFILDHRSAKIQLCREMLKPEQKQRVILISTQLIEAGVDVDFPVVFRDLCPLPNLIQSAGRCNRNGRRERGRVVFFTLIGDKGKPRAQLIYRHPSDKALLKHTAQALPEATDECDLLEVQREFFKRMAHNFAIGDHPLRVHDQRDEHANLIEHIGDFNFPVVGSFRLIDEREYGEEFRLYVPEDDDTLWDEMQAIRGDIADAFKRRAGFKEMRPLNIALENQLRKMSGRIVAVRCDRKVLPTVEPSRNELDDVCGLRRLAHPGADYSAETGLQLHTSDPSGVIL